MRARKTAGKHSRLEGTGGKKNKKKTHKKNKKQKTKKKKTKKKNNQD